MASNQATPRCGCPAFLRESVLTLDGGGMRGYASLLILSELMKEVLIVEHELDDNLDQALNDQSSPTSRHRDNQLPLPCHYFNYVFGTSTGGIITLLLGRMRLSVVQCLNIYREMGTKIFRKKRMFGLKFHQYSHKRMEKLIKKTIRENFRALDVENQVNGQNQPTDSNRRAQTDLTDMQDLQEDGGEEDEEDLSDLENLYLFDSQNRRSERETEHVGLEECRVGLIATRRGEESHGPHLFRSYYNPTRPAPARSQILEETDAVKVLNLDKQDNGTRKIKIWEAARATTAAPHYFKRIKVDFREYMDGGLVANNPSWHSWYEASSMHVHNPWGCRGQQGCIRFLVSLGTGKGASRNLFTDGSMFHQIFKIYGFALDKLTDPEDVHENMSNMVNQNYPGAGIYSRFNVPTALRRMKLDECEKKGQTFKKISKAVKSYLKPNSPGRNQLNALARQLVDHRRSKCRPQHQRYEGLSTPGPIDPTFPNRFWGLDDIKEQIRQSQADASDPSPSASNGNSPARDRSAENVTTPATMANGHIWNTAVPSGLSIGPIFDHNNTRVSQRHSS